MCQDLLKFYDKELYNIISSHPEKEFGGAMSIWPGKMYVSVIRMITLIHPLTIK